MIFGHVEVSDGAVSTHRDSYLLKNLTVVSVRRPFFAGSLLAAAGALGFAAAFADLLYLFEIACLTGFAVLAMLGGHTVAQLKLLSRETKGTELADAVWGTYSALQRERLKIAGALREDKLGGPES